MNTDTATDPYRHHPELRGRITDPENSFFRDLDLAALDARMAERGIGPDWRRSDTDREATRHAALAGRWDEDLWVFAYGSLIWDPGFLFTELRQAHAPGHMRRFCLLDTLGARGTAEAPGLMAALDTGSGCTGMVFRIAGSTVERETEILWRREMIAGAYAPAFVQTETAQGPVEALTFVADHAAWNIQPDIPPETQARYMATGTGFLGSSLDYAENLASHFAALGIADPALDALLARAREIDNGG